MHGAHVEFDWTALVLEAVPPPAPRLVSASEASAQFIELLRTLVLAKTGRGWPSGRAVAVRWCAITLLLRSDGRSLRSHAAELGVTRACLSKIALQFGAKLGLRGRWQRTDQARAVYSRRAVAVHAGVHVSSDKWERRKLREARAAKALAPRRATMAAR